MAASAITLVLLSFALAWAVLSKGGVWPSDWEISLVLVGFSSVVFAFGRAKDRIRLPWPVILLLALVVYIALTLVPLPSAVLALLSPTRDLLLHRLQPVLPSAVSAPLSVNPPATVFGLFTFVAWIATFLLSYGLSLRMPGKYWIASVPLLILAVFESGLGLLQALTRSSTLATGTYTNRDHFAGFLEMVFPFAFLCGVGMLKRSRNGQTAAASAVLACALWGLTAIIFLAIAYSLSRMGLIVVLLELLIVGVAGLGGGLKQRGRWVLIGATTAVLLAGCIFLIPDQLSARFASIGVSEKASGEIRLSLWNDTLPLIAEFPAFGCGLGGYESVFMKHQSVANEYGVEFAHNDYLQFLAELGIGGFLLLAGAIGGVCWTIVKGLNLSQGENRRLVLWSCLAALTGILVHSAADFNMYVPANAMTFAWVAGLGLATATERVSRRRSRHSP